MREYAKKPENKSRTLDSNPIASKQAPIVDILQAYKEGTLGRQLVQRERVEDEELLQAKTSGQAPVSVILRYKESIQRYAPEEEDELLRGKFHIGQRKELDKEEILQGKFKAVSTSEDPIQQKAENKTGLPDDLKAGVEVMSGFSMDDVRVYYNSPKPAQLQALAYAQGTDIHVASGQEKHLPHEAWHVVQQKQGRVQPTVQMQGVNVNDNEGLEKEADAMGGKALQIKSPLLTQVKQQHNISSSVQRIVVTSEEVDEIDSVIAADIAFQQKKAGGIVISLNDLRTETLDTYCIKDNGSEGIIVSGHGEPGKVSGCDASEIALLIKKIKNYEKAKYVYIASCDAATPARAPGVTMAKSVVDITHEVLNSDKEEGEAIPVYGATGIAINDFESLTGDFQTRYKKDFESVAILIEEIVTQAHYPDVKDALELQEIDKVLEKGNQLLQDSKFIGFYDLLIRSLSGSFSIKEAITLTSGLGELIYLKQQLLQDINQRLSLIRQRLTSQSSKLSSQQLHNISQILDFIGIELESVNSFIEDARRLLEFITKRCVGQEDISTISRTDKEEFALEGYGRDKVKRSSTYKDI